MQFLKAFLGSSVALLLVAPLACGQVGNSSSQSAQGSGLQSASPVASRAAAGWYGSAWFVGAAPEQDSSPTRAGWYGSAWITTSVSPGDSASSNKAGWYGSGWFSGAWQPEGGNTDKSGWMGTSYFATWPGSVWWNTK